MRKLFYLFVIISVIMAQGCVKSTIDVDKISDWVGISPGYVLAVVKGDVDLGDIIEPKEDTLFFNDLGLLNVVFREDSIINFALEDFYESFPTGTLSREFPVTPMIEVLLDTVFEIPYGSDFQLKEIKINSGVVNYSVTSNCPFNTTLIVQFPGVDDNGSPLRDTIQIIGEQPVNGNIILDGVLADLTSHPDWDYNALELSFKIIPHGDSGDPYDREVSIEVSMPEPDFDYVKGYFGQQEELAEADTIDLDMEDLFSKITGSFELSDPSITVNYSNSFGIPLRVEAMATGKKPLEEIDLERAPVDLLYPLNTDVRDAEGSFTIDKTNSELPRLVSMLPYELIFSGSASANPDGDTGMDNIIFGDSRFVAGIEIEIPMEFWINNLQLTDTIDNFFLDDDDESLLDMIGDLELMMFIENGFPLGGAFSITPYDSISNTESTAALGSDDFFDPAEVDASGRVTSSTEKSTVISMTDQFINDASEFDKMIVSFTLFTPNSSTQSVKIYSDYNIKFRAAVSLKADIN